MIPEQAFDLIDRGLELLEAETHTGWTSQARSGSVLDLAAQARRLQAVTLRVVGEWDADRSWAADGALSAPSWLVAHAAMSKREARQLVRSARLAHRYDRVGAALASGQITPVHVDVLANATRGRTALLERDVDTLVDAAQALPVETFTKAMQQWRSMADDEMARVDAHVAFEQRSVTWVTTFDGRVEFRVSLDAEGGATVIDALESYDRPDPSPVDGGPVDGHRTVAQRHADGLVQICAEAAHGRQQAGHPTAGLDGLIDVDRLASEPELECLRPPGVHSAGNADTATRADGGASAASSSTAPGELAEWLHGRCELRGVGSVARSTLVRLACDAAVGRIVMRGASEVLDLGRRTRMINRAFRRAIDARDRHCTFPGCDAPLQWCDVHHLIHWADGGPTDLENCTLLCRRHHFLCHEGGWRLARGPDGRIVVAVRGSPATRRRRGGPRHGGGGHELAA